MFIKHEWKIYKEVELETLSKEELIEIAKWVKIIPKEITIREFNSVPTITNSYPKHFMTAPEVTC